MSELTKERQYEWCVELKERKGLTRLGLMSSQAWHDDPKHLLFLLARYKFVAKLLSGKQHVLEIGCADAFGTRLVLQEVETLTAVDFDPVFVRDAKDRMDPDWNFNCRVHDMLDGPVPGNFDGAYSLDVIEHIPVDRERRFVRNIAASLTDQGVLIIGSPSLNSQVYASKLSKEGHVNCKHAPGLKELMQEFFDHVFVFSMNDEMVHTGYYPMAHYLIALCAGRKPL